MSDLFGIKIGRHRKNLGLPLEAKACIHQCVHGIQSRQVKQMNYCMCCELLQFRAAMKIKKVMT